MPTTWPTSRIWRTAYSRQRGRVRALLLIPWLLAATACPSFVRSGAGAPQSSRTYGDRDSLESLRPSASPQQGVDQLSPGKGTQKAVANIDDLGPVGSAARPILAVGAFKKVIIELHAVEGRSPEPFALGHLVATLRAVSGKDVELGTAKTLAPKGSNYTISEIQDLSLDRKSASTEPVISIVVLALDGSIEDAPLALAASVGATVMAIFPDKIRSITKDPAGIQAATLVHELGHILGLIDIELKSPRPREHPERPGHSTNRGSVMYWAIDRADVALELGTLPPRDFDRDDLADLADIAKGRFLKT